jgi:hypothetical protein
MNCESGIRQHIFEHRLPAGKGRNIDQGTLNTEVSVEPSECYIRSPFDFYYLDFLQVKFVLSLGVSLAS